MLSAYPPFGCSMFGTFSAPRFSLIFSGLESGLQEWRIWGPEHIKDEAYQSNFVCQNSAQRWDVAQKWMVVFVWLRGSWVTPMYLSTTLCGITWTHLDLILNLIVNAVRFIVTNVLMSHSLFSPPPPPPTHTHKLKQLDNEQCHWYLWTFWSLYMNLFWDSYIFCITNVLVCSEATCIAILQTAHT